MKPVPAHPHTCLYMVQVIYVIQRWVSRVISHNAPTRGVGYFGLHWFLWQHLHHMVTLNISLTIIVTSRRQLCRAVSCRWTLTITYYMSNGCLCLYFQVGGSLQSPVPGSTLPYSFPFSFPGQPPGGASGPPGGNPGLWGNPRVTSFPPHHGGYPGEYSRFPLGPLPHGHRTRLGDKTVTPARKTKGTVKLIKYLTFE